MTNTIEETINNITEPTKVILSTMTEFKLNKKDQTKELTNELGTIYKLQQSVVELNVKYEDRMNQLLVESGQSPTFESSGLPWGTNIDEHWVEHKGAKYLKVIEDYKIGEPRYCTYNDDGMLVDVSFEDIKPFIPSHKTLNDTDKPVVPFRMYQLASIIDIKPYEITD